MRTPIDLAGQKFGMLTAIRRVARRDPLEGYWLCQCACGNQTTALVGQLRSGGKTSCGCKRRAVDITGQRFGRLIALSRVKRTRPHTEYIYRCRCDCGGIRLVRTHKLRAGTVTTCGCESPFHPGNFVGKRFGKLVVINQRKRRMKGKRCWECKCDCGTTKVVATHNLMDGKVSSCGCKCRNLPHQFTKDAITARYQKYETIVVDGKVWLSNRAFCAKLGIGDTTAFRFRRYCPVLGRPLRHIPLKDAMGVIRSYCSDEDADLIQAIRTRRDNRPALAS